MREKGRNETNDSSNRWISIRFLEIMDCANRHGANTVPLNDCDISLLSTTSGLILAR